MLVKNTFFIASLNCRIGQSCYWLTTSSWAATFPQVGKFLNFTYLYFQLTACLATSSRYKYCGGNKPRIKILKTYFNWYSDEWNPLWRRDKETICVLRKISQRGRLKGQVCSKVDVLDLSRKPLNCMGNGVQRWRLLSNGSLLCLWSNQFKCIDKIQG